MTYFIQYNYYFKFVMAALVQTLDAEIKYLNKHKKEHERIIIEMNKPGI